MFRITDKYWQISIYPGRSGNEMRQYTTDLWVIRPLWINIVTPTGWKNTKSGHTLKRAVKIDKSDPFYTAATQFIALRPQGAPRDLFLRPLDRVKVCICSMCIHILFRRKLASNSLLTILLLHQGNFTAHVHMLY